MRKDGRLKARYHRLVLRSGGYRNKTAKKKAIVAVARTLILIIWHVLTEGVPCTDLGAGFYTRRIDPQQETRRLIARLQALGHKPGSGDGPLSVRGAAPPSRGTRRSF